MTNVQKPTNLEGYTRSGDYVRTVQLTGPDKSTASILTLGGRLLDLRLPSGLSVTLPLTTIRDVEDDGAYIGVAVGRTANRIRGGRVRLSREVSADLELNGGQNVHIHGGRRAWDKRLFSVKAKGLNWVLLYLFSPEGDQGYPGAVDVHVRYELREGAALFVDLSTRNVGDVETITNMTVHPYFDLEGAGGRREGSALDWSMHIPCGGGILEVDPVGLPTGEIVEVSSTAFDFRGKRAIGAILPVSGGFDHFYVIDKHPPEDEAQMQLVATVESPRVMLEVVSNQPGFQIYTSNGFSGDPPNWFAKQGSVAIEPSQYIDAGNNGKFPSVSLAPGRTRSQRIIYKFTELHSDDTPS